MNPEKTATDVLRETSRTFYLSIVRLPPRIQEAVMSSYLSLRAIDEIEDHPELGQETKINLLGAVSRETRARSATSRPVAETFREHYDRLPEVTRRIDEWLKLAPDGSARLISAATSLMAARMADWVNRQWLINTRRDLDRYTFSVAGAVGVLLSDLWVWYDGTISRKRDGIAYGRGLQAVNILRNRAEDLARGVDFFPRGWSTDDFVTYARRSLRCGDAYVNCFPAGPARDFCRGPQALAHATLSALERGEEKLSRNAVLEILGTDDLTESAGKYARREEVVLVNERDEVVGFEEKIKAHQIGALHRAFSVFVFNSAGQLLIQKRTTSKYHSKGLWSNTCCGHPRPKEKIEQASRRRLSEEMGFDSELKKVFDFLYRVNVEDGLIEHEYDHVLIGTFDGQPNPDREEVAEWKWIDLVAIQLDVERHPERYTYWFRHSLDYFRSVFRDAVVKACSGARVY